MVEDASWLRKSSDVAHINLAELEAVIKGLNLAQAWKVCTLELLTDSAVVFGWISTLLREDHPIKVKGLGETLVRRRLALIESIIQECGLSVTVSLVRSEMNKADILTRVPTHWLREPGDRVAVAACEDQEPGNCSVIQDFHNIHHLGVDRTWSLFRQNFPEILVQRSDIERVVSSCGRCAAVDPAPIQWEGGELCVEQNWWRLAGDITHYGAQLFLSLIDCGPSRFAIWRQIRSEHSDEIVRTLAEVFRERGPPWELLLDNGAAFKSAAMRQLCEEWGVTLVFRCAYRPAGNGIIERHHRTIKRMAARSGRSPLDMVYWYNVSPKSGTEEASIPAKSLFSYQWKPVRIACPEEAIGRNDAGSPEKPSVGQWVFVKPPHARCTDQWPRGKVTALPPGLAVEVDGVPRHIADVRPVPEASHEATMPAVPKESAVMDPPAVPNLRPRRNVRPPDRFV